MTETSELEKAHFSPLVGQTFSINGRDMVLTAVKDSPSTPPQFREPFSLIFEAEEDTGVHSDVVAVEHGDVGAHHCLVTRIIAGEKPTYQVVFN